MDRSSSVTSSGVSRLETDRLHKTSTMKAAKPTKVQKAKQAAFAHQRAKVEPQFSLNTKSINVLKKRESDVLKNLSSIEKQLKSLNEKIIHSAPTGLDPAIADEFIELKARFDALTEEHREIVSNKENLSTQPPADLKSRLLRGRVQKFLKPAEPTEVSTISKRLSSTIEALDGVVNAKNSQRRTVLSSYWVGHMQQTLDPKDVKKTAKRLMDMSYTFLSTLIKKSGGEGLQKALDARNDDIYQLISQELTNCSVAAVPRKMTYFLKIAEECLKKGDPRTAESILRSLKRYTLHSYTIREDNAVFNLPKQYYSLLQAISNAMEPYHTKELEQIYHAESQINADRREAEKATQAKESTRVKEEAAWKESLGQIENQFRIFDIFFTRFAQSTPKERSANANSDLEGCEGALAIIERMIGRLEEQCRDKATPRSRLYALWASQDALNQARVNLSHVEEGRPVVPYQGSRSLDKTEALSQFESLDRSLEKLASLKPLSSRFDRYADECANKIQAMEQLLSTSFPKGSAAAKELGIRLTKAVWEVDKQIITRDLYLVKQAVEEGRTPDIEQVRARLKRLSIEKDTDTHGSKELIYFKNQVYNDLRARLTESLVQDRAKLFDTSNLRFVLGRTPKDAAADLTGKIAALFGNVRAGSADASVLEEHVKKNISDAIIQGVRAVGSEKEKAKRMQHFVDVAQKCFEEGNFFAADAILNAVLGDELFNEFKKAPNDSLHLPKNSSYWKPTNNARSLMDKITKQKGFLAHQKTTVSAPPRSHRRRPPPPTPLTLRDMSILSTIEEQSIEPPPDELQPTRHQELLFSSWEEEEALRIRPPESPPARRPRAEQPSSSARPHPPSFMDKMRKSIAGSFRKRDTEVEMGYLKDFPSVSEIYPATPQETRVEAAGVDSPPPSPIEIRSSSRGSFSEESPLPSPRDETTLHQREGRFEQQPIAPMKLRRGASTESLESVDLESPKSKSPKTSSQSPSPKGAKTESWLSRLATFAGLRSNEAPTPPSPKKGKREPPSPKKGKREKEKTA